MADPALRIAVDARLRDGEAGGIQQWVLGLATALLALEPDGTEYRFLAYEGQDEWLRSRVSDQSLFVAVPPDRAALRRQRVRRLTAIAPLARRLRDLDPSLPRLPASDGTIERLGVDAIHFTHQQAFLTSIPSLFEPHDLQHLHLPQFFTRRQIRQRERSYRGFCEQARLVIAPSAWVRDDLVAQYGLTPEKVAVVHHPPPTDLYRMPTDDEATAIARRLDLPDRFIYYPAHTWPHKNHLRLLAALAELRRGGLVVPLVCSGQLTDHHPALVRAAADLGLAEQVRFLGFVTPDAVQVLYGRARALVFPTLYEGFGHPAVEAFRAGLPVVCSNVTSLPEVTQGAALMFDPYDPGAIAATIRPVWTDDDLAADLRARGERVVAAMDWDRTARHLRRLYRRVAGRAEATTEAR